jgi:hypothetical protein
MPTMLGIVDYLQRTSEQDVRKSCSVRTKNFYRSEKQEIATQAPRILEEKSK